MRVCIVLAICLLASYSHGAVLDKFFKISGSVIRDPTDSMRISRIEDVEPEDCALACWNEPTCKTIEYKAEHRKCDMSTADYQDPEKTIITSPYGWETFALHPDARALAELEAAVIPHTENKATVMAEYETTQNESAQVNALMIEAAAEVESMEVALDDLAESKAQYTQQHARLQATLEEYTGLESQAQIKHTQAQNAIKEKVASISEAQEMIAMLEASIREKSTLIATINKEKTGLESNLRTSKVTATTRQAQIVTLDKRTEELQASIAEFDEPEVIKARDCADLYKKYETRESGVYTIYPMGQTKPSIRAYCDMTNGGGWTVIQKRDTRQSCKYDFNRLWAEYKAGFGQPESDFWIGNDVISQLTSQPSSLRVEVKDSRGTLKVSTYRAFQMGSEREGYMLKQATYLSGNAGDKLTALRGLKFGTRDHENNAGQCSGRTRGGFWFKTNRYCAKRMWFYCRSYKTDCTTQNVNAAGAVWATATTYTTLKIRPSNF